MKITLLGTGGALPPSGRAQTGILLEKNRKALLVDCGSGVLLRLSQARIDLSKINLILLSHHHLDHMSEVLPLITARWLAGHVKTEIFGPEGTTALIKGLLELHPYVHDHAEVVAHDMKPGASFTANGFEIESMAVTHWIPTLAYKFDGALAYSADTAPMAEMARFSQNCKMLIHECSTPDGIELPFHTGPTELGEMLRKSNVKRLVLTHFYPQVIGKEHEVIASISKHFAGEVLVGDDLEQYRL